MKMKTKLSRKRTKEETELLDQCIRKLRETDPLDVPLLLESAGTLAAMGCRSAAKNALNGLAEPQCIKYLDGLDFEFVETAAQQIATDAAALFCVDEEELPERTQGIREALDERDSLELQLLGAELACPKWKMSDEQRSSILFFEELVNESLWQLLTLGESLWIELGWMAPDERERFWWRHRAYGFSRESLDSLIEAASVLTCFPEAQKHFDALLETLK